MAQRFTEQAHKGQQGPQPVAGAHRFSPDEGQALVLDDAHFHIAVADDVAADQSKAGTQHLHQRYQSIELGLERGVLQKVAIDDDAYRIGIGIEGSMAALLFGDTGMGTHAIQRAAFVDDAVLGDDVVVADVREAADLQVVVFDGQRSGLVAKIRVVNDHKRRR